MHKGFSPTGTTKGNEDQFEIAGVPVADSMTENTLERNWLELVRARKRGAPPNFKQKGNKPLGEHAPRPP